MLSQDPILLLSRYFISSEEAVFDSIVTPRLSLTRTLFSLKHTDTGDNRLASQKKFREKKSKCLLQLHATTTAAAGVCVRVFLFSLCETLLKNIFG